MHALTLLFEVLATYLVLRLVCMRATTGLRSALLYLLLGMVTSVAVVMPVAKMFNPFTPLNALPSVSGWRAVAITALLFLPILSVFFRRRLHTATSVGDAFLLAFMLGFGFDLAGLLLANWNDLPRPGRFSLLPPGQPGAYAGAILGTGYRLGLVALVFSFTSRLTGRRLVAWPVSLAVLLVLAVPLAVNGWPEEHWVRSLYQTIPGAVGPWLVLALVALASIWEDRWVAVAGRRDQPLPRGLFVREWRQLFACLRDVRPRRFLRLLRLFSLRRQTQLVRAELARAPNDAALAGWRSRLERVLAAELAGRDRVRAPAPAGRFSTAEWGRWLWHLAPWFALSALVFHFKGDLAALVNGGLMLVLLWQFLTVKSRPAPDAGGDEVLGVAAAVATVTMALGAVLLVSHDATTPDFPMLRDAMLRPVPVAVYPASTLMLMICLGATSVSSLATSRLTDMTPSASRFAFAGRVLVAGALFYVVGKCMDDYNPMLEKLHKEQGAEFFARGKEVGIHGNNYGQWEIAWKFAVWFFAGVLVLRLVGPPLARRVAAALKSKFPAWTGGSST